MDVRWREPIPNLEDVFCPAFGGLDPIYAPVVSLLPIQDFNGLLLDALERQTPWKEGAWACIFASDPFRPPSDLVKRLRSLGVCKLASHSLPPSRSTEPYDVFGLGQQAESELMIEASKLGLQFAMLDVGDGCPLLEI